MSGPMIMVLFAVLAGVTILFEILNRPKQMPDQQDETYLEIQSEVDRLEARLQSLEKIITDPEEILRRRIDRL